MISPAVSGDRFAAMQDAAPGLLLFNCESEADATQKISEAVGLVGKITPDLLAAATQLEWVQTNTASLEHYIFPELAEHPAVLTNCRGLFGDVIAEHVFGLLLAMSRNLHLYRDRQREQRYEPVESEEAATHKIDFAGGPVVVSAADLTHHRLQDWRLLIVGVGGIGAAIATRAAAWGIAVAGVDPCRRQVVGVLPKIESPRRLSEIIGQFDAVVIAAPQTPDTVGLFDDAMLARMKLGSRLINVGRGPIVQTDAVVAALQSGQLSAVGLDVFEDEPLPPDHPLWSLPGAIITPHVAACSPAIAERHLRLLCDNLRRFDTGEPLRNVVDKSQWF